jgi:hypothetical protein
MEQVKDLSVWIDSSAGPRAHRVLPQLQLLVVGKAEDVRPIRHLAPAIYSIYT